MKKPPDIFELPIPPDQKDSPTQDSTTQESIYKRLRYAIMTGSIAPGVSLTIRGLADMLEVSSTPVREAIRRLSAEGALQVLDNRRVVTPKMNLERFDELINLRVVMERYAAESALPYISDVQIDELEKLDQQMDMIITKNDHESIAAHNFNFHSILYKMNPNQVAMPMIESLWLQLGPYSRTALSELTEYYLVDHHKEAIEALRARNSKDLRNAIESDIVDGLGKLGRNKLMNST